MASHNGFLHSDSLQDIEKLHQDCFKTVAFYKRKFLQLTPDTNMNEWRENLPSVLCYLSLDEPSMGAWLDITFVIKNAAKLMKNCNSLKKG